METKGCKDRNQDAHSERSLMPNGFGGNEVRSEHLQKFYLLETKRCTTSASKLSKWTEHLWKRADAQ
eukprot:1159596-Pelagomonas_calceolata.AAC.7